MTGYSAAIEARMKRFHASLSEKDKRRYAAVEALKLGHGGKKYICGLFGCNFKTVEKGINELEWKSDCDGKRIRGKGGGRKKVIETTPGLEEAFHRVLKQHTAGSPMDDSVKWTNLSRPRIQELLGQEGFTVSVPVIDQLLKKYNFRKRKPFKNIAGGENPLRDDQFKKIGRLTAEYESKGNPVLSMDVKKRS